MNHRSISAGIPQRANVQVERRAASCASSRTQSWASLLLTAVFFEPLNNCGQLLLEATGYVDIQKARTSVRVVFEVMKDSGRDTNKRASRCVDSSIANEKVNYSFEHIEDVVVCLMRVSSRSGLPRIEPPF